MSKPTGNRKLKVNLHCVKSVRIRSCSGSYSVKIRENTNRNNSEYGQFLHSAICPYLANKQEALLGITWKMGIRNGRGLFLKLITKYWSLVNVKSVFIGTWKRDINMESPDSSNIGRFTEFMHKFVR